jgi:hypothetical protein
VKVQIIWDWTDEEIAALHQRNGMSVPADRRRLAKFMESCIQGVMDDVLYEYRHGSAKPEDAD